MNVDEQYRKCVCFLRVEDAGKEIPVGTGFFIGVPLEEAPNYHRVYLVTARHVVYASRPYGPILARVNTMGGDFITISVPTDEWTCSTETDVAVVTVPWVDDLDWMMIPPDMLATQEFLEQNEVGAGDQVFFAGLFSEFPGNQRDQPIVRFGRVALMPDEKVPIRTDPSDEDASQQVDAFLVESVSWGGYSGSPAFLYWPAPYKTVLVTVQPPPTRLLGLVHGHYDIKQQVAFVGDVLGSGNVPLNAGIAIVIPAEKIAEILQSEEFVEDRRQRAQEAQQQDSGRTAPP